MTWMFKIYVYMHDNMHTLGIILGRNIPLQTVGKQNQRPM